MFARLPGHWVCRGLLALVSVLVLLGLGIGAYLSHIRAEATALISSAREIRTKADAEREISDWRKRSGKDFWEESDSLGGEHNYYAQIANVAIARLRLAQPTAIMLNISIRDGKLRAVTVIESTGWYPIASVWIKEWFDEVMPNRFFVSGHRRPAEASVEFPASLPDDQRTKAFKVNTNCLVLPFGCRTADDILPGVLQLK